MMWNLCVLIVLYNKKGEIKNDFKLKENIIYSKYVLPCLKEKTLS